MFVAILALGAMAVTLGGCHTNPPTQEEVKAFDYGPKPENYEQIVRDYLRYKLTDPTAAIVEFKAGPGKLVQRDTVIRDQQVGWAVCAMVNDKNTRGAYAGFRPAVYFIRHGKVVAHNGGWDDGPVGAKYAREQCKTLGYEVP
jgi:hypothetical protein